MRILIVEDEPTIAKRLVRLLRQVAGEVEVQIELCADLPTGQTRCEEGEFDALFLDLNLNGRDGFDLLGGANEGSAQVVVVSAHTERALEAFELGVLDFVPKPFDEARLRKTWGRLCGRREETGIWRLAIRLPGRLEYVPMADILFARSEGASTELVLRDGSVRFHPKSLEKLLALLPPVFERVHRSYLVRLDAVEQIRVERGSRYSLLLRGGVEVPLGRTRVEALRARLEGERGG